MLQSIELFVMFLMVLASGVGCLYAAFLLFGTFSAAPFVATTDRARHLMIELAQLSPGMHVLEIGSGEGSISIEAAQHGAIATGIEINPVLVWYARLRARFLHVGHRTTFVCRNFWNTRLPKETQVVFLYLLPGSIQRLLPKLRKELKPGTVIISHAFSIAELPLLAKKENIFLYRLEG